jgi:phosphoglycolate phosphatase-like HAD superfamily hydrolase
VQCGCKSSGLAKESLDQDVGSSGCHGIFDIDGTLLDSVDVHAESCGAIFWTRLLLLANDFELAFLLLIHELTGVPTALGPTLLAHDLGLELGALADRALAGVVADRFVDGHDLSS